MNTSKDIFLYSDYRQYLHDYYIFQKKQCKGFTLATIAQQAGFASPSFYKHLIDGKRNLTKESAVKVSLALKLTKPAASYFESLVFFNQSQTLHDKIHFLTEMDRHRPKNTPHVLSSSDYRYLEKWYHPVIRELVELPGFLESPEWIAKAFMTPLRPEEAQKALLLLESEGFLVRTADGYLAKRDKTISAIPLRHGDVLGTAIRHFHLTMLQLAQKAVAENRVEERTIGNTTLSLSAQAYEAAVKRIEQLRSELMAIASSDKDAARVYQLTVSLFPLTRDLSITDGTPRQEQRR